MDGEIQEKLAEIEELFIENISENMRTYGIPTTVGRVLGIIYMNRAPMTFESIIRVNRDEQNKNEPGRPGNGGL